MPYEINYKGWTFYFDDPPSSADLEAEYEARVTATEVKWPVATPTQLERETGPRVERPLEGKRVVLSSPTPGAVAREAFACLRRLGAEVGLVPEQRGAFADVVGDGEGTFDMDWETDEVHGVVLDTTSFEEPGDLDILRQTFRPSVMALQASGRCVLLAGRPQDAADAAQAATWYSLDGFIRSLSGEMGHQGVTSNILRVASGAEPNLAGPLRFLLSPRSAFITGQTIWVDGRTLGAGDDPAERALEGKTAIVTGAAGGMGKLAVGLFAHEGADVICIDRPGASNLEQVAESVGGRAIELDVTSPEAPDRLAAVAEEVGGVDILAHVAGTLGDKMLANMDAETWNKPMSVNFEAPMRLTERLLRDGLIHQNGRIMCVSSVSGICGGPTMTAYSTSKSGVNGFVKYLSQQLDDDGTTLNVVAPGFTLTPFNVKMPQWMKHMQYRINDMS